jgi:dihydrofolate synthase / folylpolyglutamate synthase
MNYEETIYYLYNQTPVFQHSGASAYKPGLDNAIQLDSLLESPHHSYPTIHVGGTNGKGSVSNLLASILQESGFKVGLYTSPHLKDFRERIRINGQMIPEAKVVEFVKRFIEFDSNIQPSFFELTSEMAFDWFKQEAVDIAIIEVGLGGRLDSTNIISPIASVITNISFDHVDLLGHTLEAIAFEKAGIMKKGVPTVIGKADEKEVEKVFTDRSKAVGCSLVFAKDCYTTSMSVNAKNETYIVCEKGMHMYNDIMCALSGSYQQENAATVLTTIDVLRNLKWDIVDGSVYSGFKNVLINTGLRGRWEKIGQHPDIICDTGHNVAGIRYVVEQIRQLPHKQLHFVIGMVGDKDIQGVLKLLPKDARYYFTKASIPRAMPEMELRQSGKKYDLIGLSYSTVSEAIEAAKKNSAPEDLIFIGGSTFVVAEALNV